MGQRVTYGTAAILFLLSLFLLDVLIAKEATVPTGPGIDTTVTWRDGPVGSLLRHGSVLPLTFLVVILAGARELVRLLRSKGARPCGKFAGLMIALILAVPWLSPTGLLGSGVAESEGLMWSIVCVMVTIVGAGALVVLRRDTNDAMRDVGATVLIVTYLGFLSSFGLHLRCSQDVPGYEGAWLLLITVMVTKSSDIGAYFAGSAFGRHKLIPEVSPGKSVEGMVGGLAASALVATALVVAGRYAAAQTSAAPEAGRLLSLLHEMTQSFSSPTPNSALSPTFRAVLFGLAMSAAGQMGDLIESSFKRDADIKDSGGILPRFGGILDLVDSPVVSMPVAWLLLTVVWNVV